MKNYIILTVALVIVVPLLGITGCGERELQISGFDLEFKYGITARNVLNTFEGTYTKDMVADPPITIDLTLSEEEKEEIYLKMEEIDFFDYPDEFSVEISPGTTVTMVTPYSSYYFRVARDSQIKELRWDDNIKNPDEQADRLRELIMLIRDIVESKEEYRALPTPTSAYS
jgi:hypothetical protein